MAVPGFGQLNRQERAASWLMFLVGALGLLLTVTGVFETIGTGAIGEASPRWMSWSPWRGWLILQSSALAVAGFTAAMGTTRFGLVLAGVIAGLVVTTPVGLLAILPSLWLLILVIRARTSFDLFKPRWTGPDPPPPGNWRR